MKVTIFACLLGIALVLGGCASENSEITGASVRWDMTPEMQTEGRTPDQHATEVHRTLNENGRQIWDDWDNFWLIDEPMHLTQWPVP
jgi:hypothetical protein